MSYQRKSLQILGGGFNCLPSVDKVPQTDYLVAQNFRVDRFGRLVSRFGYQLKFSIAGAGFAHSCGSFGGAASPYYVGANSSLTSPASKLYYNGSSSAIATGFDGNRIGFASQNGFMHVMNRAVQGKHNAATGWQGWNLTAPPASLVVAAGSSPSPVADVVYTFANTGNPAYVHYITVAGTTYSLVDSGYNSGQIAFILSTLVNGSDKATQPIPDPNATATYPGTGASVTLTPIPANILIPVSASDGNSPANLANGSITSLPNGTYQFYCTFVSADLSTESNPSPSSLPVTVASQPIAITIPTADAPVDTRIGFVNIYATGGTLNQPYLIGQVASTSSSPATAFLDTIPDLQATNRGVVMPTNNDPPPAASGIIGPFFGSLFAWSTAANINRLFFTNPGLPQYFPGSANPNAGNWVDVGDEGEAIVWCTIHSNVLVIYKEKSIWMMIGSPLAGGTLQQYRDGMGITGQFAVVAAGLVDYFVGPGGLHKFDLNNVSDPGAAILPLFTSSLTYTPGFTPPGSILPGSYYNSNLSTAYAVALGYGMGKLYIGYAEQSTPTQTWMLLVYHEDSDRWFYHRNAVPYQPFLGFFFDGTAMLALGSLGASAAVGINLDDFRSFATTDPSSTAIECIYQSHYENCGLPENQKMWLEVVVDIELPSTTGSVWASFDNRLSGAELGTLSANANRQSLSFPVNSGDGTLAKNISIEIDLIASGQAVVHNVYLYYYVEQRQASSAATIPVDLGIGQVKQCKELQLDIDTSGSAGTAVVLTDLPGNVLATRQTITVPSAAGRGIVKFPFAVTEGFLWQLIVTGTLFRLYAARLLMRVMGTYIESYEAAAGFVWDSMEMTFDSGITHIPKGYLMALASFPVKRAREILFEIDTINAPVTLTLITDLPGNSQASRFTATITANGRRFVRIPLPQGGSTAYIEGRIYRVQLSGTNKFILYGAAIDVLPVGVYIEAYESAASPQALWDSTTQDMGDPSAKTFDEIRIEIETDAGGSAYVKLYTDLPGEAQSLRGTYQLTSGATGRAWVTVPVAQITGVLEGRSIRLNIYSSVGFRLYAVQVRWNKIGRYIAAASLSGSDALNTLEFDYQTERVKAYKRIEVDMRADDTVTLNVITSQASTGLSTIYTKTLSTPNGRTAMMIPLPPGVRGRLLRIQLTSASAARIYHVRVLSRELNETQAKWEWGDYPLEQSSVVPGWKELLVAPTPQDWFWAKILSVVETADTWEWVDVPFEITDSGSST